MHAHTVFLTHEPVTARVLRERLLALMASRTALHARHLPPVLVCAAPPDAPPGELVLVSHEAPWEWVALAQAGTVHLVHVRPEMLALREAFGEVWPAGSARARAWAGLVALDRQLAQCPSVWMEDVHGGGSPLWPALAAALDLPWPEGQALPAPPDGAATFAEAMAALLSLDAMATRPEGLRSRHLVRWGGDGLRLLGRGWSGPEPGFVWSDGETATLLLPAESGRRTSCRIEGMLMRHPEQEVDVSAWLDDACLGRATAAPNGAAAVTLELALPAAGTMHAVELRFGCPVRPRDVGAGEDGRALGLALAAVELRDEGEAEDAPPAVPDAGAAAGAPAFLAGDMVAALFARVRPGLAVVLAASLPEGLAAARAVLALGAGRVLLTRAGGAGGAAPVEERSGLERVSLVRAGPAPLAEVLAARGETAGLAVLCDEAQFAPWLDACAAPAGARALAGAALVLASGDPYAGGAALFAHARAGGMLLEAGEGVMLLGPPPP